MLLTDDLRFWALSSLSADISNSLLIKDFEINPGFPNRLVSSLLALSYTFPLKNIPAMAFSAVPFTNALR